MTMIQQEFRADGLPSLRPYLQYLLDNGLAEHVKVKWGKSERWVIKIAVKPTLIRVVTKLIRT